jgi:hypothetical protein
MTKRSLTARLSRPARETEDRERATFPAAKPCHDCAFRKGSPEREDPETWAKIKGMVEDDAPFYCHYKHTGEEMPTDDEGNYNPKRDAEGHPTGYPLCKGWCDVTSNKWKRVLDARK